jgi:hypothetical protein
MTAPTSTTPDNTHPTQQETKRSLLALWGVLAVCAAPVIAAFVVYFFFKPEGGKTQNGELLGQIAAPLIGGQTLEGKPFEFKDLRGQWIILTVGPGACGEPCAKHLWEMRQIRTSLGKKRDKVDRVWLVTDNAPIDIPLLKQHESLVVVRADPAKLQGWLGDPAGWDGRTWFIDWKGDLMMTYRPGQDPMEIRKDLGKLLHFNTAR